MPAAHGGFSHFVSLLHWICFYMIASLSDSMYCLDWLALVGVRRMFSKSLSRSCHGVSVSDMLVEVPSVCSIHFLSCYDYTWSTQLPRADGWQVNTTALRNWWTRWKGRCLKSSLAVVHELLSDWYGFQNLSLWFAILHHAAICKAVYAA